MTAQQLMPTDYPSAKEIEVSVFGKGYGESIVIHVGDGKWVIVDSVSEGSSSLARCYLEGLGVELAVDVEVIIATHWHDDHVRGISDMFSVCEGAEFTFPAAMLDDEFVRFAAAFHGQKSRNFSSGVEEFGRVIGIARSRKREGSQWPLRGCGNGYVAYRKNAAVFGHGRHLQLEALSPSHFEIHSFLARVSGLRPDPAVVERAPRRGRNDVSSAFWLQIGDDAVLLGADVENSPDCNMGWKAILASSVLPAQKASLVKLPHHGGKSGHHDGMWSDMLIDNPVATLTPWAIGGNKLPVAADVTRIEKLVGPSFSTGPAAIEREAKQPEIIAKNFRKDGIVLKRVSKAFGQVRHRAIVEDGPLQWRTEVFGRACKLSEMKA